MRNILLVAAGFSLLAATSAAHGNILTNGSLELNPALSLVSPDNLFYASYNHYFQALPGWTITGNSIGGSVDVIPTSYFTNTDGGFCVDLVGSPGRVGGGNGVGGIQQAVSTIASFNYTLTFDYSVNPENFTGEAASTKSIRADVIAADNSTILATQTYTLPVGSRTKNNLQWVNETLSFTATGAFSTIRLSALTPTGLPGVSAFYCGPLVDNVILLAGSTPPDGGDGNVPEPSSLALLGLGMMALVRRRK